MTTTRGAGREKSTSIAGHSRVQSSFRFAVRNLRPLASASSMKSSDQRWFAMTGHQTPARGSTGSRFFVRRRDPRV